MTIPLPPRPRGDVAGTWAAIGRLEGYRGGLRSLKTSTHTVLQSADGLEGLYLLGLSTFSVGAAAEVDIALAGVDAALANLRAAVRGLERDLRSWQSTCDRIRAANAAAARP